MNLELHHFFTITDPGAPQADLLSATGLVEGARNDHPGQGTANRRFFFPNSVLELLYVRDVSEAATGPGNRLRFAERSVNADASPFGLVVSKKSEDSNPPFPGWRYCPDYFPPDQCFHVGENSDQLHEPLCICMPPNLPMPRSLPGPGNPLKTVTELRVGVPVAQPSETLQAVAKCELISICLNQPHRMEVIFNHAQEGQLKDMAPDLPLVIRW